MTLSENQKHLIVQTLQTQIKKTQWVVDNKDLEGKKKDFLLNRIQQMEEIIQILQPESVKN